jgi:predicted porin
MTSLKKLIAVLAVSLPLAALAQQAAPPAAEAAPLYQWYGTLNVNGQYVEISKPFKASPIATPANATGRYGVSVDSSNIGIRGTADTGQFGLSVVYQCETSAQIDGDATAYVVCNRNSRLGLSHEYGTLFYGNWDSPFKAVWYGTKGDDAFGNTDIYDAAGLLGSPGFKVKSAAGTTAQNPIIANAVTQNANFNVRAANTIGYHSPKVQGLQVKLQVTPNEKAPLGGRFNDGQLWSGAINYDRGPISVFAAYERHDDWAGLQVISGTVTFDTKTTTDTGIRVGAGYELGHQFGTTTLGAVYEYLDYKVENPLQAPGGPSLAAADLKEYNRGAFMVNLKHRWGNHEVRARYQYADNGDCKLAGTPTVAPATCNFDIGRGAQNYAIGYAYYLSKAAQVYAFATKIENERNASYTFATAGPAVLTGTWSNGADPFGAGLGIRYAF